MSCYSVASYDSGPTVCWFTIQSHNGLTVQFKISQDDPCCWSLLSLLDNGNLYADPTSPVIFGYGLDDRTLRIRVQTPLKPSRKTVHPHYLSEFEWLDRFLLPDKSSGNSKSNGDGLRGYGVYFFDSHEVQLIWNPGRV